MRFQTPLRFSHGDLALFQEVSHDSNPLHVSAEYARKTAYGQPVVFGILGVLSAIDRLDIRVDAELTEAEFEFCNPLHAGVDYGFEVLEKRDDETQIRITEADRLMTKMRFRFRSRQSAQNWKAQSPVAKHREACVRTVDQLAVGHVERGGYAPDGKAFQKLFQRFALRDKGLSDTQLVALIWSSYFVGMEFPGRDATFWKLRMQFNSDFVAEGPLDYTVELQRVDRRFDVLELAGHLEIQGERFASLEISSFLRASSPRPNLDLLSSRLDGCRFGKPVTALIVGGSRGFGAALALGLAVSGAHVYVSYERSREEAENLQALSAGIAGKITIVQGNAANPEWGAKFAGQMTQLHGGLDLLICNASPAISSLPFAPETLPRFRKFVDESLDLIATPLAVFMGAVAKRSGTVAVISSQALSTFPLAWPHYVTAKAAVEGLVQWASASCKECAFLTVRPPKLFTGQTNTPLGRHGAIPAEDFAAQLVRKLCEPARLGSAELFEGFTPHPTA